MQQKSVGMMMALFLSFRKWESQAQPAPAASVTQDMVSLAALTGESSRFRMISTRPSAAVNRLTDVRAARLAFRRSST